MEVYWKRQVSKSCGCLRFRGDLDFFLEKILDRHERSEIAVQWNGGGGGGGYDQISRLCIQNALHIRQVTCM